MSEEINITMEPIAVKPDVAAKLLDMSTSKIYDLIHRADFPAFKSGGCTRISVAGLRRWVEEQTGQPQPEREVGP